jgi:hypothetical protein
LLDDANVATVCQCDVTAAEPLASFVDPIIRAIVCGTVDHGGSDVARCTPCCDINDDKLTMN